MRIKNLYFLRLVVISSLSLYFNALHSMWQEFPGDGDYELYEQEIALMDQYDRQAYETPSPSEEDSVCEEDSVSFSSGAAASSEEEEEEEDSVSFSFGAAASSEEEEEDSASVSFGAAASSEEEEEEEEEDSVSFSFGAAASSEEEEEESSDNTSSDGGGRRSNGQADHGAGEAQAANPESPGSVQDKDDKRKGVFSSYYPYSSDWEDEAYSERAGAGYNTDEIEAEEAAEREKREEEELRRERENNEWRKTGLYYWVYSDPEGYEYWRERKKMHQRVLALKYLEEERASTVLEETVRRQRAEGVNFSYIVGDGALFDESHIQEALKHYGPKGEWPRLHRAVASSDLGTITQLLGDGMSPDIVDQDGDTGFHVAARLGLADIINLLHRAGANPNVKNVRGWVPIHLAILLGQTSAAKALLRVGASANILSPTRGTPLHHTLEEQNIEVLAALVEAHADLEAPATGGIRPLHFAALMGRTTEARLLLNSGANKDASDDEGNTPLLLRNEDDMKQ